MASELTSSENASLLADRRILILYGSETGNSQDSAEDLDRMAERLHFTTRVEEMNDVELSTLLEYPLVIFITSTTGQGEFPSNARNFWKSLLRKRLPTTCLSRVKFTTFGLGDSSYSQYNWAARKLHKRLEQLGATEFYPRGEADERHDEGIEGAFLPWSISLRSHLLTLLPEGLKSIPPDVRLPPKVTLQLLPTMEIDRTAALFSHADVRNPRDAEAEMYRDRVRPPAHFPLARESQGMADAIGRLVPGGFDALDRPNILRDDAVKYSLEDSDTFLSETTPPDNCLPIPSGWEATLLENERVTPSEHWQDVRLLRIKVYAETHAIPPRLEYNPGDCVVIYPKNFPNDVQQLIDRMEWNDVADQRVRLLPRNGLLGDPLKNIYPLRNTTIRQLLIHNYDITAIPKRNFFEELKGWATDPMQKERLDEFSNPAHTDEFFDYTSRPRRSILEILHDFDSVKVPWEHIPSIFPKIRGREYSISSGGPLLKERGSSSTFIEILVALVKYKTVLRKTRKGLCSRYIESLMPGTPLNVTIKRDQKLKYEMRQPILAIAAGTGIAPVRAIFWDRWLQARFYKGREVLFYGGRNVGSDYHFHDDWTELQIDVNTAFSRDQKEKIYVQDVIRREAKKVCSMVSDGACVVICGSAGKMPEAVRAALYDVLVAGNVVRNHGEAKTRLQENGFWEEVW